MESIVYYGERHKISESIKCDKSYSNQLSPALLSVHLESLDEPKTWADQSHLVIF
jgi:hypothetical protein